MKNIFLFVVVAALITIVVAFATDYPVKVAEAVPTSTVAPTATPAPTSTPVPTATPTPKPNPTPQTVTTFWVTTASNCGLPDKFWNRSLYSVKEPQFTAGNAFKLEMPEFWIVKDQWVEPPLMIAFPPMTTGGQDVYCNFRTWKKTFQLVLP